MNLKPILPILLPLATRWANKQSQEVQKHGRHLNGKERDIARLVGVSNTDRVKILIVDKIPSPTSRFLQKVSAYTQFSIDNAAGLTLGYSIYLCEKHLSMRLLSHELRHVHQYEQYGSMKAFLKDYLSQVLTYGYLAAPLERDARNHELTTHNS